MSNFASLEGLLKSRWCTKIRLNIPMGSIDARSQNWVVEYERDGRKVSRTISTEGKNIETWIEEAIVEHKYKADDLIAHLENELPSS